MKTEHLTKAEFLTKVFDYENNKEWKYQGDTPAIIDFYADWCGPCKMIAPVLEELAKEYDGKVKIYKIDTEAEQELAAVFGQSFLFRKKVGKLKITDLDLQRQMLHVREGKGRKDRYVPLCPMLVRGIKNYRFWHKKYSVNPFCSERRSATNGTGSFA
jgi:thiol-disulfide isomerase/thioredoxin